MEETESTKRRAELFFEKKTNLHITTFDNKFYNGLILNVGSDFLLLADRYLGETFVLLGDIKVIEPYKEREE